ncbi:MAG: hypothetical protein IJ386_05430 [Clostridia bacterium]|nr:hypothetical protein [Clostridia bacterium]
MFDKEYLKRVLVYVSVTVMALIAVFLIGYHIWLSITSEIETVPAVPQTFQVTAEYDAWVFRDETAITNTQASSGTVVPSVRNGEKVGKNDSIAYIYRSVPSEKLSELESIRSQIRLLEGKRASVVGGDLGIGDIMLTLASAVKNGNISAADGIADRLTALVAARSAGGGNSDGVINSLKAKEKELLSSLGESVGSVSSNVSGWYYSNADGFESVFTKDAVLGITPEKLDAILQSEPVSGSYAGRVVHTYKWYIAVNMTLSDGMAFTEGQNTDIKIPGVSDPIRFSVESVVTSADGRAAVVFSTGVMPENLSVDRHLTLSFTLREVTGFGIPKDAVRVVDDNTGVYIFSGLMAKFRRINILEELDDIYVAEVPKDEQETLPPETAAVTGTDTVATTVPETTVDPIGDGAGRKEYLWLDVNDFIIVKGKALHSGKIIG